MVRRARTEPLYRKVNTQTHGVRHDVGGDYRTERNDTLAEAPRGSMHGRTRRGLDYTPLFRFLISRVGKDWNHTYSEAVARLDRPEPIFWMVALEERGRREMVRIGESSYFSGLYVDEQGILRKVSPDLSARDLTPFCSCCTHTFNGERFGSPG